MTLSILTRLLPPALLFAWATNASAQTAAEIDWVQRDAGTCSGEYVQPEFPARGDAGDGRVDAVAGRIEHVQDDNTTLSGGFELTREKQRLQGDFATLDASTDRYVAEGQIRLREPDLLITGERIEGDLFSGTAIIDSASFLLHQQRLRGTATRLEKQSSGEVSIADGTFTTCDPESNAWALSGKTILLKPEQGYGVARNVKLAVKDVPVAWFPYLRFPLDDRRQSGILLPSLGNDSEGGLDLAVPYYFNLAPHMDATYTLRTLAKRGIMHEGEFRFLTRQTDNLVAATFLPDDDVFDDRTQVNATNPGQFEKQNRWLGHIQHQGRYGRLSTRINYASVSDIDYFRDLGGFTATDSDFDRSMDLNDSPALLRHGMVSYSRQHWQSRLELRNFQQLSQNRAEQYEILPRLTLSGQRRFGGIVTEGKIQYTEFDLKDNSRATGSRTVADAGVSLPFRRPWGYVTPAVQVYHRNYSLDNTTAGMPDSPSINTRSASVDAGIYLDRQVNFRGTSMIQTLEPRLHYLYVEEDAQNDLPVFDSALMTPSFDSLFRNRRYTGYDRIGDANRFAAGLTTRFLTPRGQQVFSASVGQLFHLEDRQVSYGEPLRTDLTADTSPVFTALNLRLGRFSAVASYEFDADSGRSNRSFTALRYRGANQSVFNVSHTMTDQDVQRNASFLDEEETDLSFIWPLRDRWHLIGRWNYGWDSGQTIESMLGVEYNDCCWKARVVFRRNLDEPRFVTVTSATGASQLVTDRRADSGIYLEIQLKGIGSLGGRLDSLLRDAIPGYETTGQ